MDGSKGKDIWISLVGRIYARSEHYTQLKEEFRRNLRFHIWFVLRFFQNIIKKHSRCEIEDFVETHLCKRCVILRSRVVRVVYPH